MTLMVALADVRLKIIENGHLRDRYTVQQLFLVCPDDVLLENASDKAVPSWSASGPFFIHYLAPDSPIFKKVDVKYSSVDRGDPNALLLGSLPARVDETKKGTKRWIGVILFGSGGGIGQRDVSDKIRRLGKSIHEIGL